MTPVKQTIIYNEHTKGNGDCVVACYASLLDIPLWMVPPFHEMHGRLDRGARVAQWLERIHNLELVTIVFINTPEDHDQGDLEALKALPEFYIAMGPTVRKEPTGEAVHHAVIYTGDRSVPPAAGRSWRDMWPSDRMIHDPHSSDLGLEQIWSINYLRPLGR